MNTYKYFVRFAIQRFADEVQMILAFDILFWTGCREGEMLALLPKDLTDDDQLRIYKTYHRKKGRTSSAPPRTAKKEATEMYLFHIGWPKSSAPTVPGSTG